MTIGEETWTEMRKYYNLILDFILAINSGFILNTQCDITGLYQTLLNTFCEENPIFEFVKHHLFCFYQEIDKSCSNVHHSISLRNEYLVNLSIENCKKTKEKLHILE